MMRGRKKKKTILEERIRYKEYYIVSECDQCDIQDKLFAPITTNTYIKSLNILSVPAFTRMPFADSGALAVIKV